MTLSPKTRAALIEAMRRRRLTGGWATDPTPGPYPGHGPIRWRRHETPELRAFRRFPINQHKPRWP